MFKKTKRKKEKRNKSFYGQTLSLSFYDFGRRIEGNVPQSIRLGQVSVFYE